MEIITPVQILLELEVALHREWQRTPQQWIQRLVQGITRVFLLPLQFKDVTRNIDSNPLELIV